MTKSALWYLEVGDRILTGMQKRTSSAFDQFSKEAGVDEDWDLLLVQAAAVFDPAPITSETIRRRARYSNPEFVERNLHGAVERGWLMAEGGDRYRLTARGRDVVRRYWALADETYASLETLPETELEGIAALLNRVVEKAWAFPEPAEKWGLGWRRKGDRGPSIPSIMQVRARMLDLFALRDDVHIAAWQPYGVDGQTWEALTLVWRGRANTAAELVETLPYRTYGGDSYARVLNDLTARGWVTEQDGKCVVTAEGSKVRQEAEDSTNRLYDAPWAALSEAEVEALKDLLGRLTEALAPEEQSG
jgi:DNA-binding MarR family transcriptional regulator